MLSICANAVYNVIQSLKDISSIRIFCKDIHEALKYVDEFSELKKMTKLKKNTHLSLSLSLSLLVDLSMHFDFPEMMCMYQSLSLSLSIYICKNGLDPDQTRMEFKKECFVNLKICACDRKYAKCRTKADAHDKMDLQYISISVYIVRSHARIQRGDRGSGPLSNTRSNPLKFSEQPSQHSDPNGIQERMFRQFKHLGMR